MLMCRLPLILLVKQCFDCVLISLVGFHWKETNEENGDLSPLDQPDEEGGFFLKESWAAKWHFNILKQTELAISSLITKLHIFSTSTLLF